MKTVKRPNNDLILWLCQNIKIENEVIADTGFLCSDWKNLVVIARRNGVLSLLYQRIRKHHTLFPEAFIADLKRCYLMSAVRSELLTRERNRLIKMVVAKHVPLLLLKGVYLRSYLYHSSNLRPMRDIDVLIPANNIKDLYEIIYANGGIFEKRPAVPEFQHHLPACFLPKSTIGIEIHYAIAPENFGLHIDTNELWQRSINIEPLQGVFALSHEDLLLHLCIHIARADHYQVPLRSYYDVYLLLLRHGDQLDWHSLCCRARTWGCAASVYIVLLISHQLFGISSLVMSKTTSLSPAKNMINKDQILQDVMDYTAKERLQSQGLTFLLSGHFKSLFKGKKELFFPSRDNLACMIDYQPGVDPCIPAYARYWHSKLQRNMPMISKLIRYNHEAIHSMNQEKRFYLLTKMDK